jgi:hypothetical protein
MELILGLPPMSQYDAAATPLWRPFTNKPDLATYTARPSNVDLNQKNTAYNDNARKSEEFNFAQADAIPDDAFSEVIWKTVKGERSVMPAPRRSAFIRPVGGEEEEGEED